MNYFKDIIIGVIGGLITFCITSTLTEIWDHTFLCMEARMSLSKVTKQR